MSRKFLLTKFVCSVCGNNLSVDYKTGSSRHENGEPTGADMVEHSIAVEPCGPCAAPLQQIRSALAVLAKQGGAA